MYVLVDAVHLHMPFRFGMGLSMRFRHSPEPGILDNLWNGDSLLGVHHQHMLYQGLGFIGHLDVLREGVFRSDDPAHVHCTWELASSMLFLSNQGQADGARPDDPTHNRCRQGYSKAMILHTSIAHVDLQLYCYFYPIKDKLLELDLVILLIKLRALQVPSKPTQVWRIACEHDDYQMHDHSRWVLLPEILKRRRC